MATTSEIEAAAKAIADCQGSWGAHYVHREYARAALAAAELVRAEEAKRAEAAKQELVDQAQELGMGY